jgi:hypothetical protein
MFSMTSREVAVVLKDIDGECIMLPLLFVETSYMKWRSVRAVLLNG